MSAWGVAWGGPATPTGYVSALNPVFKYYAERVTISSTNNTITFGEGGGALTGTVASGNWSWGELAWKVKVALEAAGAGTYTVTYSHTTRKFTITKDSGTFTLDYDGANNVIDDMGFTGDKSGALTYTSDTAVPAQTTLTLTQRIKEPEVIPIADRQVTRLSSGRRETTLHGVQARYRFRIEFETVASAQGLYDFWANCAAFGNSFEFYPDSTDLTQFFEAYWDAEQFPVRRSQVYRLYEVDMDLEIKAPEGSSTITTAARALLDRRPTA